MLTRDTALRIAYAERPDMLLQLAEFTESYALADKPALIVQACPEDRNAAPTDSAIKAALSQGTDRNVAWWDGFRTRQAVSPIFRGFATEDAREDPQWAFEMNRDGSCIAGVWAFPNGRREGDGPCMQDFYAGFFEDFANMALRLTSDAATIYKLTATLLHANRLSFDNGGWSRVTPAPRLATLQWPLRSVSQPDTWHAAVTAMNIELFGAYGLVYHPKARDES